MRNASMDIYPNNNDALSSEIQTTTESVELLTSATIEAEEPINTTPGYVYKLVCRPTGQFYYGYRVHNIKKCRMPIDDLWVYYFSSSDYVKALIKEHGKAAFDYEIILESTDRDMVFRAEQELIEENRKNPLILNRYYRKKSNGEVAYISTVESIAKGIETRRKNGSFKSGAKKGAETRKASGIARIAAKKAVATRRARGTDKIGIEKTWKTKTENNIYKTCAKKGAATRKARGTDKIGGRKGAETRKARGTDKIAGQKAIATKIANGTLLKNARKIADNKKARGTDKIGAKKAAATKQSTGVNKIAAQKAAATKKATGVDKIATKKALETRRANGNIDHIMAQLAEGNRNTYKVTSPTGEVTIVTNMPQFCDIHGLNANAMRARARNQPQKPFNGWLCEKVDKSVGEELI